MTERGAYSQWETWGISQTRKHTAARGRYRAAWVTENPASKSTGCTHPLALPPGENPRSKAIRHWPIPVAPRSELFRHGRVKLCALITERADILQPRVLVKSGPALDCNFRILAARNVR